MNLGERTEIRVTSQFLVLAAVQIKVMSTIKE